MAATLFLALVVGNVCPKVCPVGNGCRTKICPGDGRGPGHIKVTYLSCGWGYVFVVNYVRAVVAKWFVLRGGGKNLCLPLG